MEVKWVAVASSFVRAVAHTGTPKNKLYIRFKGGEVAEYDDVPRSVYNRLLAASSKGKFVNRVIRNNGKDNLYTFRYV